MNGYIVVLQNGNELYFPDCSYWKDNGGTLTLKDDRHGAKIARFNWDAVTCIHKSDSVQRTRRNTN